MCGACSPECPTYRLTRDENFSPRGRIATIRAIARDELVIDQAVIKHLDTCLHCFSCQKNCPSQVNYAALIHYAQQKLQASSAYKIPLAVRLLHRVLTRPGLRRVSGAFLALAARLKLTLLARPFFPRPYRRILSYALPQQHGLVSTVKSDSPSTTLLINPGCVDSLSGQKTLQKLAPLFTKLNLNVVSNPRCCGAIAYRYGQATEHTIDQQAELLLNSACAAYAAEQSAVKQDIHTFLVTHHFAALQQLKFKSCNARVMLHASCSVRNRLHNIHSIQKLLDLVPGLKRMDIPLQGCCGAGGDRVLHYPDFADGIAAPYTAAIRRQHVEVLLSTDISCALHIREQLLLQGYTLEVMHPLGLLCQYLEDA